MNDQTTHDSYIEQIRKMSDEELEASLRINYDELAATEPDQPGGRIVYHSGDYATDEEASAALDAFFERIIERTLGPDREED
jgi:hypothetical protein